MNCVDECLQNLIVEFGGNYHSDTLEEAALMDQELMLVRAVHREFFVHAASMLPLCVLLRTLERYGPWPNMW